MDAKEGNWKSLLGETLPFGEQELTSIAPEVTTQTSPKTAMCSGQFCFISNTGKFVDLTELYTRGTSHQDMNISISIGILCILALVCIIAITVFLSKFWHHQCYRNNRVTPHEMELAQLPAQHNTSVDHKNDVPTVCAHVKTIQVTQARLSKIVGTPSKGKREINATRSYVKTSSEQEMIMSCPGFLTDVSSSSDTLFERDRNLMVRDHR